MVLQNKGNCCEWLLEIEDGSLVKDSLMCSVFRREQSSFKSFLVALLVHLALAKEKLRTLLKTSKVKKHL